MTKFPKLCEESVQAILKGVECKHPVFNLEWLGVPIKVIQMLTNAGIMELGDLMSKSKEDLLKIESFGETSLYRVFKGLSLYHRLKEFKNSHIDPDMRQRIALLEGDGEYGEYGDY